MIGSILDLFPRRGTPKWDQLPPHVREEVELLRKGFRPISQADMDEYNLVPKRVAFLKSEVEALSSKVSDVHVGQSELGEKLIPLVEMILTEQRAMRAEMAQLGSEVGVLKSDRDKHVKLLDGIGAELADQAKRIDGHDTKHAEHVEHITGVHQRLIVVEQLITTKLPKRRKPVTKRPKRRRKKK